MSVHDDDLNDWLDALVIRRSVHSPAVDPDLAVVAARFLGAPLPRPDSRFAATLEETLMHVDLPLTPSTRTPVSIGPLHTSRSLVPETVPPRRWVRPFAWALTVAAVAIVALVTNLAIRDEGPAIIVAPSATSFDNASVLASPSDASCPVPPRDRRALAMLTGAPGASLVAVRSSGSIGWVEPDRLPDGTDLSPAEERSLEATLALWSRCGVAASGQDPAAVDRLYGLYTDDYFRRVGPIGDGTFPIITPPFPGDVTTRNPLRLADGRIAVVVEPVDEATYSRMVVVFRPGNDLWQIDEIVLIVTIPERFGTPYPILDRATVYCGEPFATWGAATVSGVTVQIMGVGVATALDDYGTAIGFASVDLRIDNATDDPVEIAPELFGFAGCADEATAIGSGEPVQKVTDIEPAMWPSVVPPHSSIRIQVIGEGVVPGTAMIGEFTMRVVSNEVEVGTVTCPLAATTNDAGTRASVGCSALASAGG